jgi:hypothetical protein
METSLTSTLDNVSTGLSTGIVDNDAVAVSPLAPKNLRIVKRRRKVAENSTDG